MGSAHDATVLACKRLVELHGGRARRLHQGPGRRRKDGYAGLWGDPGLPDLACRTKVRLYCHPCAAAFFIEVKVGNDLLTHDQVEFISDMNACGIETVVGGLSELAKFLGVKLT